LRSSCAHLEINFIMTWKFIPAGKLPFRWRAFLWFMLPAISVVIAGAVVLVRSDWPKELAYGQFKKRLVAGDVSAVTVGPNEITGALRERGRSVSFRTSRLGMESDQEIAGLLDRHAPDYDTQTGPGIFQVFVLPVLLAGALLAALYVLVRRSGMGSAMAFARSRPSMYGDAPERITFGDVAGIDEAKTELREVVEFLRTPEKYRRLGGRIPKGILLVGPPGTGKTLLAKAVAGEAGVPFFALSGSDFVEMFVGVGAARVRSLFAQAESKAPCLIFIDELDALGKARGTGGTGNHDERDQTLNQLLVAMDGFSSNSGVIVMAATNRPETLDPALVRPGRFDRNVAVDRPDLGGREEILRVHVRNVPIEADLDLRKIAAMTSGFVGADLANLVNEAALLAARKGKTIIERLDFEEGVERILAGPERKQRVIRKDELERIAYHEAGHALVARLLPGTDPVHKVSIVGRGSGMGGYTMYRPEDDRFLHTQGYLAGTIRMLLGGTVAEEVALGDISDGASSDLQRATQIARRMVTDFGMSPALGRVSYQTEGRSPFLPGGGANDATWSEATAREIDLEVRRILDEALADTRRIIGERRDSLHEIARLLIVRETIGAAELDEALAR
jgi:cell division protease FtsH